MVNVAVSGASGRMGKAILASIEEFSNKICVSGALEYKESPSVGEKIEGKDLKISSNVEEVIKASDVLIDFTTPSATLSQLEIARKNNKAVVIGTTGLSKEELAAIDDAAKTIPIVFSPNMSIGVNLLFKIIKDVTSVIGDSFDIEIMESHHHHKKDAPSGTAKKMAQIIAQELGRDLDKVGVYGREGMVGARKKEEIGIHVIRAGDIVGEHTALFAGSGERIEITHKAHSRTTFAVGAVRAAIFAAGKENGLYTMNDVLGLA